MQKISKKILPEYFQLILDGKKTFELRLNDFDIEEGDVLILKEWDKNSGVYTGREIEKTVGHVKKFKIDDLTIFYPIEEIESKGLQIISLL